MTLAFQQQNFDNLKTLYDEHQKNVDDAQKAIDTIQERIAAAKKDQRDYEEEVREFDQTTKDKAAQLEFDKVKEDNTMSYRDKELAFNKMQLSETTRHNKATELEAEKKRLQEAAGNSFDVNTTPFASMLTSIARSSVPRLEKPGFLSDMAQSAQRHDWSTLMVDAKNQVSNGLRAAGDTALQKVEDDIRFMDRMKAELSQYEKENPGGTGLLKGTQAEILAKAGQLSTDERYRQLATDMNNYFTRFRADITGAAFSPDESAGYQALVPSGNKSIALNTAVIEGNKQYLEGLRDGVYERKMGPGYTQLKGVVEAEGKIQSFMDSQPEDKKAAVQADIQKLVNDGVSYGDIIDRYKLR